MAGHSLPRPFPGFRPFSWDGLSGPPPKRPEDRNPYPPPQPPPGPPVWFQRYWPVVLSVVGFIAGLVLLVYDVREGSLTAIPAVVYLTLMGYLPVTVAAKWFKNGRS
jgi:hypothetical protein